MKYWSVLTQNAELKNGLFLYNVEFAEFIATLGICRERICVWMCMCMLGYVEREYVCGCVCGERICVWMCMCM